MVGAEGLRFDEAQPPKKTRRSELIERLDSWNVKVQVYVRPHDHVMSVKSKWFFEEARLWQTYRRSNKPSN